MNNNTYFHNQYNPEYQNHGYQNYQSENTFTVTKNTGMDEETIARLVPINSTRVNRRSFMGGSLVANPMCVFYIPDRAGTYDLNHPCQELSMNAIQMVTNSGKELIEARTSGFCVKIPIVVKHGFSFYADGDSSLSFTANCFVSIDRRNTRKFFDVFSLSSSSPRISIEMIEKSLSQSVQTLMLEAIDGMGNIENRTFIGLMRAHGLYLRNVSVSNYQNSIGRNLKRFKDEIEQKINNLREQAIREDGEFEKTRLEQAGSIIAAYANSGAEPEEIERILTKFDSFASDSKSERLKSIEEEEQRLLKMLNDLRRRCGYRDHLRPGRPQAVGNALPGNHQHHSNRGYRDDYHRNTHRNNDHNGWDNHTVDDQYNKPKHWQANERSAKW